MPKEEPRRLRLLVHQAMAEDLVTPVYAATILEGSTGEYAAKRKSSRAADQLQQAAEALAPYYAQDPELTEFANADLGGVDDDYF